MIVIVILFSSAPALGMCTSETFEPILWNSEGNAVVVRRIAYGPEGGGSDSYSIIDFKKRTSEDFGFSSDFSPGDGSKPQTVSTQECKNNAAKANQLLTKLSFELRFKENFFSCRFSRTNLLPTKDLGGGVLVGERGSEVGKKMGLSNSGKSPVVATNDGVHFVIIEENSSCIAKCYGAVLNENQNYEKFGVSK